MSDDATIELRSLPLSARFAPAWRTAALASLLGPGAVLLGRAFTDRPASDIALAVASPLAPALSALPDTPLFAAVFGALAALVAVAGTYTVARVDTAPFGAERAAWLMALSPITFCAMVDPLTALAVATTLGALGAATRRRFALAGVAAAVATIAVPAGWLAWFGATAEYVRVRGWRASDIGARALALLIAPAALLATVWLADGSGPLSSELLRHAIGVTAVPAPDSIVAALTAGQRPDLFAIIVFSVLVTSLLGGRRWPVARLMSVAAVVVACVAPAELAKLAVALAPAPVVWVGASIDRRRSLDAPLLVGAALALAFIALA